MPEQEQNTTESSRWKNAFLWILGLGAIAFLGVWGFRSINTKQALDAPQENAGQNNTQNTAPQNTEATISDGIVVEQSGIALHGALKSENYTLGQLVLGGDVALASSDAQEFGSLEISSVRGESFMSKDKKDVNVLITWKTTKLSQGTLTYGKNGTDTSKTIQEDGYGVNHSIIVNGLDQASAYVYTITAVDRSGNKVSSESYAIYTGTKSASLFDLISGAVTDTFGWAIKK